MNTPQQLDFVPWDTSGMTLDEVFSALFALPVEKRLGRVLEIKPRETKSRVIHDPRYFELDPEAEKAWAVFD